MDPSPVAENDPFSLGDSDEEKDATVITLKDGAEKDNDKASDKDKDEDEQVKKATDEAMKEGIETK